MFNVTDWEKICIDFSLLSRYSYLSNEILSYRLLSFANVRQMNWLPYQTNWVSEQIPKYIREVKILQKVTFTKPLLKNCLVLELLHWKISRSQLMLLSLCMRMHELLLCCESSHRCHHAAQTTPTWTKTMFYKIDCWAEIHGRMWMDNEPNESRIITLSHTEINFFYISLFDFEKFGVKPRFPVF